MLPHQQRVIDEKTDLDDRRARLAAFIGTDTHCGLPEAERARLRLQLGVMALYSEILEDRIAAFPP